MKTQVKSKFKIFHTKSEAETRRVGQRLAKVIDYGTVISLKGNLGSGKTVFIKGFAKGLGIKDTVASPTFNIVREHNMRNDKHLYHMDLYRIDTPQIALDFGINEYIEDINGITVIEWAERIEEILPKKTIHVEIKRISDTERRIKIIPNLFSN